MRSDIELTCSGCGQAFWTSAMEGRRLPQRCANCSASTSMRPHTPAGETAIVRGPSGFRVGTADVQTLLEDLSTPLEHRRRTLLEWLRNIDLTGRELARKQALTERTRALVNERTALAHDLRAFVDARSELEVAEFRLQVERIKAQGDLLRSMLEEARLTEELTLTRYLGPHRLRTRELQELGTQRDIRARLRPSAGEDETQRGFAHERFRLRSAAAGRQAVISDFLDELQSIYRSQMGRSEKALRIRSLMDSYEQEADDLPREIRTWLLQTEEAERE